MAQKKNSGSNDVEKTRAEAAEALKRAAELIASLNGTDGTESDVAATPTAKKPAAKSTTAKKPTAKKQSTSAKKPATTKSSTAKSTAAKKPATKKTAASADKSQTTKKTPTKKPVAANEPPVDEQPIEPVEPVKQETVEQPPVTEEKKPVAEPAVAEEPKPEPEAVKEPEPIKESEPEPVVAPAPAPVQTTVVEQKVTKTTTIAQRSDEFIKNKGKFPLFIVANALLLLSSILLMISAFDISIVGGKSASYNLFAYLGNGDVIKGYLGGVAGEWANGAYTMLAILMLIAFIVPLALVVKNVIVLLIKKDKSIYAFDAIVAFAFLVAYLGLVNLFGANMTAGQIIAFAVSVVLLAFTVFVMLLQYHGKFPIYSICNIVFVVLAMFLLTANPIYTKQPGWYAAAAASASGGGGFAFIMMLVALAALVLLAIIQLKKLPAIFDIIVPAAAGVCALIALISYAGGKPDGLAMGGGFVFAVVLIVLAVLANILFALVPPLKRMRVKLTDSAAKSAKQPDPVETTTVTTTTVTTTTVTGADGEADVASETSATVVTDNIKCVACGVENEADAVFCSNCGRKLN